MIKLLERLSEMFPKQDYQSRLEEYIKSKNPTSPGDVEYWQREYDQKMKGQL